jgi:hypothetical protein
MEKVQLMSSPPGETALQMDCCVRVHAGIAVVIDRCGKKGLGWLEHTSGGYCAS